MSRRVALVTGGARRIGAAIVRRLAADGFDVAIHCNGSRHEAEALAAALAPARCAVLVADLANADAAAGLVPATVTSHGSSGRWGTYATNRAMARRCSGSGAPSKVIEPVKSTNPAIAFNAEDLPAPFGPTSATHSPLATSSDTSHNAGDGP